jgi:hypothetical protein
VILSTWKFPISTVSERDHVQPCRLKAFEWDTLAYQRYIRFWSFARARPVGVSLSFSPYFFVLTQPWRTSRWQFCRQKGNWVGLLSMFRLHGLSFASATTTNPINSGQVNKSVPSTCQRRSIVSLRTVSSTCVSGLELEGLVSLVHHLYTSMATCSCWESWWVLSEFCIFIVNSLS